jgi:hypothetical protein
MRYLILLSLLLSTNVLALSNNCQTINGFGAKCNVAGYGTVYYIVHSSGIEPIGCNNATREHRERGYCNE